MRAGGNVLHVCFQYVTSAFVPLQCHPELLGPETRFAAEHLWKILASELQVTFAPALEILTYSVAVDEYEHEEAAVRRARQRRADRDCCQDEDVVLGGLPDLAGAVEQEASWPRSPSAHSGRGLDPEKQFHSWQVFQNFEHKDESR
ncbi:hypothetical protein AK812_SmicGene37928 [Symbiodinium microadriaticum]|uniref:Uncharacterized protein n=1 Tax=Symbiodinium microadriaticum TaxID=2951 RepID=A0A1Q9CF04_SYMMI|nr:hypothetical protein AK812_SmicGene37928 [Symbiodinium microadriaticum]